MTQLGAKSSSLSFWCFVITVRQLETVLHVTNTFNIDCGGGWGFPKYKMSDDCYLMRWHF